MARLLSHVVGLLGIGWFWLLGLCGAAVLHFGTAILRLDSFFPSPQALDFSSYYGAAWALRLGQSPYAWSSELLAFLAERQQLAWTPPVHNSPPLWPFLLQPVTLFPFPTSATLWLLALLLIVLYSHYLLMGMAGYRGWKAYALSLPFTITFGPLFLNLTLGQNGVFLLLGALLLGEAVKRVKPSRYSDLLAVGLWVVAVGAKIFPLLWVGAFLLLKRWQLFASAMVVGVALFGFTILAAPSLAADYWLGFLPNQSGNFSAQIGIDDQSLGGFLSRVGRSTQSTFLGLSLSDSHMVSWEFPWNFSAQAIHSFSLVLLFLLGVWLAFAWLRSRRAEPEAVVYGLVLFTLLPFPHMERYNHILALPALAWLWGRGGGYRHLAVVGYGLFGLSRLNHFWAAFLPSPLGPIATGFGLFGVLLLLVGLSLAIHRKVLPLTEPDSTPHSPQWAADRPGG